MFIRSVSSGGGYQGDVNTAFRQGRQDAFRDYIDNFAFALKADAMNNAENQRQVERIARNYALQNQMDQNLQDRVNNFVTGNTQLMKNVGDFQSQLAFNKAYDYDTAGQIKAAADAANLGTDHFKSVINNVYAGEAAKATQDNRSAIGQSVGQNIQNEALGANVNNQQLNASGNVLTLTNNIVAMNDPNSSVFKSFVDSFAKQNGLEGTPYSQWTPEQQRLFNEARNQQLSVWNGQLQAYGQAQQSTQPQRQTQQRPNTNFSTNREDIEDDEQNELFKQRYAQQIQRDGYVVNGQEIYAIDPATGKGVIYRPKNKEEMRNTIAALSRGGSQQSSTTTVPSSW